MGRKTVTEKFDPCIQLLVTVVEFHTFTTRLNFEVKLMPLISLSPVNSHLSLKNVCLFFTIRISGKADGDPNTVHSIRASFVRTEYLSSGTDFA